ncbi:hypothetical protein N7462_010207 [Penicillium macrosclerotiorum]|uniref:uncharacterized protein n=1 Tax=Penicillium macrosclerotiorum TaxID=303699 RepID=UPI0025488C74|nr:uncharacterized protein N7462_010207 [Penicillium macrosclerotiorum]KAJ5669137.1 hypothetical protein N7462_010207 [Penicillium macrosclerotiorum]
MSFLAGLCGCFTREDATPRPSSRPEMQSTNSQSRNCSGVQTGRFTLSPEGEFIRSAGPDASSGHGSPLGDSDDGGYASVVPLPQYTPRPVSIHEKTLEAHLRDPPMSSDANIISYHDEKNRNVYDDEVSSDSSSTISYPSSYGNTSTATRETPPPPYSPRHSAVLSRSRSISISSAMAVALNPPPMARLHGGRPGPHPSAPPSEADDRSIHRHRRVSWESR